MSPGYTTSPAMTLRIKICASTHRIRAQSSHTGFNFLFAFPGANLLLILCPVTTDQAAFPATYPSMCSRGSLLIELPGRVPKPLNFMAATLPSAGAHWPNVSLNLV